MHINELPIEILQHVFEVIYNSREAEEVQYWRWQEQDFKSITKVCKHWNEIVCESVFLHGLTGEGFYQQWQYDSAGVGRFQCIGTRIFLSHGFKLQKKDAHYQHIEDKAR